MLFARKKKSMLTKEGLVPAGELVIYVGLIAVILSQGNTWFRGIPNYAAIVLMLSMLSFSVLVCALIVLARPYQLFADKKGKEALNLVVSTAKWLAIWMIVVILLVILVH